MSHFTLSAVESNIEEIKREKQKNSKFSYVELLCLNHTLMAWVMAHGESFLEGLRDTAQLDPFWSLLQKYDIQLNAAEKMIVLHNFLDD